MNVIETERLILRTWKKEDAQAYYHINQDPKVIEFLRGPLSIEEVNDIIIRANAHYDNHGYACWATELKETGELIGYIGLNFLDWNLHFIPAVEIGWRLGSAHWGKGYATEGAKACLDYGFNSCGLHEIIAFTAPVNKRSIRVMEKIGMVRDPSRDFNHPKLEPGHRLSKQIVYTIKKPA